MDTGQFSYLTMCYVARVKSGEMEQVSFKYAYVHTAYGYSSGRRRLSLRGTNKQYKIQYHESLRFTRIDWKTEGT